MSCVSGTNIVNDGLVFSYDMNNTVKSWKGKPTTNEVDNPSFLDGTSDWLLTGRGSATHNDIFTVKEENGIPYLNIHWERHTGSGNSWANIRNARRYTDAVEYTYSVQYRLNYLRGGGPQIRHSAVPNDYWTPGKPAKNIGSQDLNKGWQNLSLTRTFLPTYTRNDVVYNLSGVFEIYSHHQPTAGDVVDFDIRLVQVERNSFATPFNTATRSNTEALIDISGQENTITADSLTYNTDGTFEFVPNGELIVPHSATLHPTDAYTSEVWLWADSSQDNSFPRVWDKGSILVHLSQTSPFTIAQNTSTSAGLRQVSIGGAFSHSTWTHITTSYDGQVGRIYVNGSEIASTDWGSVLAPSSNSTSLGIGGASTSTTRQFNGKISTFRFYNRALSADEIKQNFEASRTKYGI